jgi:tetratricopeptide (TPR) repeat protein
MPLISLAMIVKNEESNLASCLESVKGLIDEIIIIDSGSTDNTIEIAKAYGAQVRPFKWCDDFAAARNESIRYCNGDWVLFLDADEAIDALDHEKVKNACRNPFADAYSLTIRNYQATAQETTMDMGAIVNNWEGSAYTEGKGAPFYSDNPGGLRLAMRFDGLAFAGRIHETIGDSLMSREKSIKPLNAIIHHYGKLLAAREQYKAVYYLSLTKQEADKAPDDIGARFNLLQQALVAEEWELALEAATACLEISSRAAKKLDSITRPITLYGVGLALQKLERHAEAIGYFDQLLAEDPNHAMATLCKGFSLAGLGKDDEGRSFVTRAVELEPGYVPAHGCLAELELRQNNHDAARKIALGAIDMVPNEPSLYDLLLKIELARGNHHQASQDALLGIKNCPSGGGGKWHRTVAVFLAQNDQVATAKAILELGLKAFPGDPDLTRIKGMI